MTRLTLKLKTDDHTTIKVVENTAILEDVLSNVEDFLRGCGYIFKGELKIVQSEEGKDKKIYIMSEFPAKEEIRTHLAKVYGDVNQMKFPFEDENCS